MAMETKREAQNRRARAWLQTPKGRENAVKQQAACRQRKHEWLRAYKLSQGCADCGYRAHWAALEFDHPPGTKSFTIGGNVRRSYDQLSSEIAKCDVVCANCHSIRTANRRVS